MNAMKLTSSNPCFLLTKQQSFSTAMRRVPSIKFRYVKGQSSLPEVVSAQKAMITANAKNNSSSNNINSKVFDFLETPPFYGRLKPLSKPESDLLESGGASQFK